MGTGDLLPGDGEQAQRQVFGVVIGIVTSNQDPDGLGRVKVQFPWRGDSTESSWARLATPMAGSGRGMVFYPEVNDEVLVAFEQGDINRPYVLGALWNGVDKPPEPNSNGKNDIRMIRSRSGHVLLLDDTPGKEKVQVKTKAGHTLTLDDAAGAEKIEIMDKTGSNSITIDSAKNEIALAATQKITLKAMMVELEGTSSLSVKSNGMLTIQGSMVKIN
jgi:uncharacterized protein involved in type VI secretion and phage assembly